MTKYPCNEQFTSWNIVILDKNINVVRTKLIKTTSITTTNTLIREEIPLSFLNWEKFYGLCKRKTYAVSSSQKRKHLNNQQHLFSLSPNCLEVRHRRLLYTTFYNRISQLHFSMCISFVKSGLNYILDIYHLDFIFANTPFRNNWKISE